MTELTNQLKLKTMYKDAAVADKLLLMCVANTADRDREPSLEFSLGLPTSG